MNPFPRRKRQPPTAPRPIPGAIPADMEIKIRNLINEIVDQKLATRFAAQSVKADKP